MFFCSIWTSSANYFMKQRVGRPREKEILPKLESPKSHYDSCSLFIQNDLPKTRKSVRPHSGKSSFQVTICFHTVENYWKLIRFERAKIKYALLMSVCRRVLPPQSTAQRFSKQSAFWMVVELRDLCVLSTVSQNIYSVNTHVAVFKVRLGDDPMDRK